MADKKYIGITIGPIFKTMSLVSTPAALWASSYMFSCITKYIREELVSEKYSISPKAIISPYYDENFDLSNGIGLLHDRIIFEKPENFDVTEIKDIRSSVLEKISSNFNVNNEYLDNYVLIAAAEFSAENPIMGSGIILDSLELSTPLVFEETSNPIFSLFTEDNNEGIKKIAKDKLNITLADWQLLKDEKSIKSLKDIALPTGADKKYKKYKYYAIVRSDGDNMSKIIKNLHNTEEIQNFSKICLEYCADIANKVKEYEGVAIYAGGDDLLALMPCESNGMTLFNFISAANDIFAEHFQYYIDAIKEKNKNNEVKIPVPSLSFGIYISYYKFPLYEAITESASLLFDTAKSVRDCAAVKLQKHSGQIAEILVPNQNLKSLLNLQNSVFKKNDDAYIDEENFLLSASQKIALFKVLFNETTEDQIDNVFRNIFDAEDQKKYFADIEAIKAYFKTIKENNKAEIIDATLRIVKFFVEEKGEE